jgi:succinate dehydrogenase / fumarate reductase, cytochrome b subunit
LSVPPKSNARPLSPHLQVWRWHITMASSIFHRATGAALYGGALGLAAWFGAAAFAPDLFAQVNALLFSPLGQVALYGLAASLCYHLANGVRHLIWDAGHGLEPKAANSSAWLVIGFGLLAPLGLWALALAKGG